MTFEEIKIGRIYSLMYHDGPLDIINIVLEKNNVFADVVQEEHGEYMIAKTFEYDDPSDDDYTYYEDVTEGYILSPDFDRFKTFELLFGGAWL